MGINQAVFTPTEGVQEAAQVFFFFSEAKQGDTNTGDNSSLH